MKGIDLFIQDILHHVPIFIAHHCKLFPSIFVQIDIFNRLKAFYFYYLAHPKS